MDGWECSLCGSCGSRVQHLFSIKVIKGLQPKIHDNTTIGNKINKSNIIEVTERESKHVAMSDVLLCGNV